MFANVTVPEIRVSLQEELPMTLLLVSPHKLFGKLIIELRSCDNLASLNAVKSKLIEEEGRSNTCTSKPNESAAMNKCSTASSFGGNSVELKERVCIWRQYLINVHQNLYLGSTSIKNKNAINGEDEKERKGRSLPLRYEGA
ncbi:uncharacterized protein LOC119642414 [Glossina fuscipes]|uniref:Uncharacterized protein LOC119642414 n=1 Tax=Glossina fuscipes TaxID=7396 RepID=A0A9C5ZF66_9MUSC|nr:uncharacterized protein LOC119642414 [Glossina fuscipes]